MVRLLHQFWTGAPMPAVLREFAAGWRRFHPDWEYRLWGAGDLPALRNQHLYDRAEELCPGFEGQLRSDVVRYELLLEYGGVWVDADFECLRPLDDLLDGVQCFAAWEIQDEVVNNAILGCEAGNAFMARLVEDLPASVLSGRSRRPSKISGPRYLTAHYREDPDALTVFDELLFYPYSCHELERAGEDFSGAYGVHHWMNQRRLRSMPL